MTTVKFTPNYPAIVCLGDSQTQYGNCPGGFVASLADRYQRKADVISRGFNGYTTRDVLPIVSSFFSTAAMAAGPDVIAVTLWLGCNDSINPTEKQYVSPEEFTSNLRGILDVIRPAATSTPESGPFVLVISPTPVSADRPFHTNERKELYTDLVRTVVSERAKTDGSQVEFLNVYDLFLKHEFGLAALLHDDGLHISSQGYKVLSDAFRARLTAQPGLDPDAMPSVFPDWKTF